MRREGEDRLFIGGLDLFWMFVNVCGWLQQKSAELNKTHEQNTFIRMNVNGTHSFRYARKLAALMPEPALGVNVH